MADLKKLPFLLFIPRPQQQCSHSDIHPRVNYTFSCRESHNSSVRQKPHSGRFLIFPFLFFFFNALTLTPWGAELQRALINGSGDAPALRHSPHHNRRSCEAEQGTEYWRIEWKRTQNKGAGISPVVPQSPTHCRVLRRGVQRSIIYQWDQRKTERTCIVKQSYQLDLFLLEMTWLGYVLRHHFTQFGLYCSRKQKVFE